MKKINRGASVLVAFSILFLAACKSNDPQPETVRILELLTANTWTVEAVTVDEMDQTNLFTGLTLSFTNTTYSTTNGGAVWPANGTWEFADASAKTIVRDDGLQITISEVTSTSLRLALTWSTSTLGSGRTASVPGDHEFSFIHN